jgi:tetratricopeptide (TPR) repeat protein
MNKYFLLIILLSSITYGFSQKIHSPAELIKIMNDSKLSYEIKVLDKPIECMDYSDKLNYHDYYRVSKDSGLITYKFNPNNEAKQLFDRAEKEFQTKNIDNALIDYRLALKMDSSLSKIMTYIGQIYSNKGDYDNAIKWYKMAISKNYIDYMAHWFLADLYLDRKDFKNAVDEIVIAQILNRNNSRIKKSWINILEKAKRNTEDWCFKPQMEISKISDNKISVSISDKWTGYAVAKALWTYEPGYRELMGVSQGQYSTIEDKECLISLLVGLENAKINIKKDAQLRILKKAVENKHLDEYILYEIVLPKTPFVAFQLPE